ncbi:MAG: WD40 repeat domain-containing protein [Gemmataceae bacterium]|nr:WD40 repeat domain-containing protein [Gemmataceae bacterium]
MVKSVLVYGSLSLLVLTATTGRGLPLPWGKTPPKDAPPKPLLVLRGHTKPVLHVQHSPDGKRLATASADLSVVLWDANTGKRLLAFESHADSVNGMAWSPDGKRLVTGSPDGIVKVWDTATGRTVHVLTAHAFGVSGVAFSPCGDAFASVGLDRDRTGRSVNGFVSEVTIWDARTGKQRAALVVADEILASLAYSPDGRRLAGGGLGKITVWEVVSKQAALTLDGHSAAGLMFSPNGRQLAVARDRWAMIALWDLATGKASVLSRGHTDGTCVAFSLDGKRFASAAVHLEMGDVQRWVGEVWLGDTATGDEKLVLRTIESKDGLRGLAFSPDGRQLATAHGDSTVRIWSAAQLLARPIIPASPAGKGVTARKRGTRNRGHS